jgi:hypothetical protein
MATRQSANRCTELVLIASTLCLDVPGVEMEH